MYIHRWEARDALESGGTATHSNHAGRILQCRQRVEDSESLQRQYGVQYISVLRIPYSVMYSCSPPLSRQNRIMAQRGSGPMSNAHRLGVGVLPLSPFSSAWVSLFPAHRAPLPPCGMTLLHTAGITGLTGPGDSESR